MEPRSSDTIIADLKKLVESRKSVPKEHWLECAFDLCLFRIDEAHTFNVMNQAVAQKKLTLLKDQQGKKNVSAAAAEIEASDEYLKMKDQEAKIYSIDELIRVAKRNGDLNL